MERKGSETEWCLLQNQFDSYEKHSLYIKLISIIVLLIAKMSSAPSLFIVPLLAVLWLQDVIWNTFQSRIEARLLQVEKCISEKSERGMFQFNSAFQKARLRGLSLINEYIRQSIRPTIAFPHVALILLTQF